MRLAHKRKVQLKLQKHIKATVANIQATKKAKPVVEKKVAVAPAAAVSYTHLTLPTNREV